jgi:hypothetical protein
MDLDAVLVEEVVAVVGGWRGRPSLHGPIALNETARRPASGMEGMDRVAAADTDTTIYRFITENREGGGVAVTSAPHPVRPTRQCDSLVARSIRSIRISRIPICSGIPSGIRGAWANQREDDASVEDVMDRLHFLAKVARGLDAANRGDVVSHDEVEREFTPKE